MRCLGLVGIRAWGFRFLRCLGLVAIRVLEVRGVEFRGLGLLARDAQAVTRPFHCVLKDFRAHSFIGAQGFGV